MDIQQQQIEKQGNDGPSSTALQVVAMVWYFFVVYTLAGMAYSAFMEDATITVNAAIEGSTATKRVGELYVAGKVRPNDLREAPGKAYVSIKIAGEQHRSMQFTADLDKEGRFAITPAFGYGLTGLDSRDQVEVHVKGAFASEDGYTTLYSEGSAFLNKKEPYSLFFKIAMTATILLLVFSFFTGPYKELDHRVLVTFSYVLIAVSIIAPFWLFYKGGDFLTPMETKAVGILQVGYYMPQGEEIKSDSRQGFKIYQWALNIGGIPKPLDKNPKVAGNLYDIYGGIVVPVFVLILALFGGAVRMAQRIPELQDGFRYYEKINLMHVLLPGLRDIEASEGRRQKSPERQGSEAAANKTRGLIIQQITFLITSPVIAVAVYYMMMIINPELVQSMPVVVILAFTAGFMTDKVLKALAEVGSGILDHSGWKPSDRGPAAKKPAPKPAAGVARGKKP